MVNYAIGLMQEIEIKFLDIDPEEMERRLIGIGAKKQWTRLFEEWIYEREEWLAVWGRVRVRNDGYKTTVSYKETLRDTGQGNPEIEFETNDLHEIFVFLEKMGLKKLRHQQKKRSHFTFDELVVDVDIWPKIPALLEIEGPDKSQLLELAQRLGLDLNKVVELDTFQIYKRIYNIDIDLNPELVF